MKSSSSIVCRMGTTTISIFLLGCSGANVPELNNAEPSFQFIAGDIKYGPERTVFKPCNSDEIFWLNNANPNSNIKQAIGWDSVISVLQSQAKCTLHTMPCDWQTVTVKGRAIVNRDPSKAEQKFWIGKGFGHDGNPAEIRFYEIGVTEADICSKLENSD